MLYEMEKAAAPIGTAAFFIDIIEDKTLNK